MSDYVFVLIYYGIPYIWLLQVGWKLEQKFKEMITTVILPSHNYIHVLDYDNTL